MTALAIKLLVGAVLGAALGYFGQCNSGTCPLTANWKRGAVYGAVLGLIFHFASGGASGPYRPPKHIKAIAEADFDAEVLAAGKPVVVDFFAPWCGPCKTLAPRLDEVAGEFGDRIKFVSVNIDQAPTLATRFKVEGVPTLLFFGADGKIVNASVGLIPAGVLRTKVESLVSKQMDF